MKYLAALMVLFAMALSLSGCNGTSPSESQTTPQFSQMDETSSSAEGGASVSKEVDSSSAPDASDLVASGQPEQAQQPSDPSQPDAGSADSSKQPPQEQSAADASVEAYFDNTLFVGDSIMEGIRQYVMGQRESSACLGEAKFLTTTIGISLADLVGEREAGIAYSYKGSEMSLEEIVTDVKPQRIFLLLGLNDLSTVEEEPSSQAVVDRYARLIQNLKACLPDAQVVVITNPPKINSSWLPDYAINRSFNNQLIGEFCDGLKTMCQTENVPVLDAHGLLEDESGALPEAFCRDGYVHLNNAGSKIVVDALYDFAREQSL